MEAATVNDGFLTLKNCKYVAALRVTSWKLIYRNKL